MIKLGALVVALSLGNGGLAAQEAQESAEVIIGEGEEVGKGKQAEGGRAFHLTFEVFSVPLLQAAEMKRARKGDAVVYQEVIDLVRTQKAFQDKLMEVRGQAGQEASVEVIREYVYPTSFNPPEVGNLPQNLPDDFEDYDKFITPAVLTDFETRNLGDAVEVSLQEQVDESDAMSGTLKFSHVSLIELEKWGKEESEVATPRFDVQALSASVRFERDTPLLVGSLADPTEGRENHIWMVFATTSWGDSSKD